jgi:hypothetical protein
MSRADALAELKVSARSLRRVCQEGEIRRKLLKPAPGRPHQQMLYAAEDVRAYIGRLEGRAIPAGVMGGELAVRGAPAALLPAVLARLLDRPVPAAEPKPWLTLEEATAFSGLPRLFLLKLALGTEVDGGHMQKGIINVAHEVSERRRWRFSRAWLRDLT